MYFKPLCGPHRRQNRAKSASYPAPTGTKGTRVPCILGTQARQGCPIPGCNPTPQHAADGGRQARCPVPAPKPQPHRSPPAARPRASSAQRQAPPAKNIVQWVVPRQAISSARYAVPPMTNSTSCPGAARRWKQTDIQTPPVQYGRMTPSSFAIVCAGGAVCNHFVIW